MKKGNAQRRHSEYVAIRDAVKSNKDRFVRRLSGLVHEVPNAVLGTPCQLFLGTKSNDGYGKMNFTYRHPGHKAKHIQISAHRVFMILRLARPIKLGFDAGHMEGCPHRHCVSHVFEQSQAENYNTNGRHDSPPF